MRVARWAEGARGGVIGRHSLHHPAGQSRAPDQSAHLRAASGLAWMGTSAGPRLIVAQDDTSFVAVLDRDAAVERSLALPHAVLGRRVFESRLQNKMHKLDLEACASLPDGSVLIVGSGSHSARERVVLVSEDGAELLAAPLLYASLRGRTEFAGSELNVEGAAVLGAHLVLANRGNGAPQRGLSPTDAIAMLRLDDTLAHLRGGPVPALVKVAAVDLGAIAGVRLTFTDLCARAGALYFLASAEASPNAVDDGIVVGTALGRMKGGEVLLATLVDEAGALLTSKVEGLAWAQPDGSGDEVLAVVDRDDPDLASECLRIRVPPALL